MKFYVEYKHYCAGVLEIPDDIKLEDAPKYIEEGVSNHELCCDTDPEVGGYIETIVDGVKLIENKS